MEVRLRCSCSTPLHPINAHTRSRFIKYKTPWLFNQNVLRFIGELRMFGWYPSTYNIQSSPDFSRISLILWPFPAPCSSLASRNASTFVVADGLSEERVELVRTTAPSDSSNSSNVDSGVLLGCASMRGLSLRAGDVLGEDLLLEDCESER